MKNQIKFHHILRIYIPEYAYEQRLKDILNYCTKTECKEVLLFTSSYDMEPSFVPLEQIRRYTDTVLKPAAEQLRKNDIVVSINVMQTLGHVYYPESLQQEFPFQRRVFQNKKESYAGACPLCENLRSWVAESYRIYAEVQARVLLVDDDFRTKMEELSCFCKLHLSKMSEFAGKLVQSEDVVNAILSDKWPTPELREIYFKVTTDGFAGLASVINEAVKSVSPQTQLGVMTAGWPVGVAGIDWDIVLKALSGNDIPIVRPQVGIYSENEIRDIPGTFMNPDCFRSMLTGKIEFWPEIENYPFTGYSKSARLTLTQMVVQLLNGFNHHALDLFDFFDQPFEEFNNFTELLAQRKVFFDTLANLIPEGSYPSGVKALVHRDALKVRRSTDDWFGGHNLANFIPNLGMPLTYSGESNWQLLCGDDILAFSDDEIDKILSSGALMDACAAEALGIRGFGERIGVKVGNYIPFDELGYEEYLWPEETKNARGRRFPLRMFLEGRRDWKTLIPLGQNHIPASVIKNYRSEVSGIGMLLTENVKGERFAILGFSQTSSRRFMENRLRAEQLRHSIEWIAGTQLPLAISPDVPYLWPIINRTADGRLIIGIINLSTDKVESIPVISDSSIKWSDFFRLTADGNFVPVDVLQVECASTASKNKLSCTIEPFDSIVFVQQ